MMPKIRIKLWISLSRRIRMPSGFASNKWILFSLVMCHFCNVWMYKKARFLKICPSFCSFTLSTTRYNASDNRENSLNSPMCTAKNDDLKPNAKVKRVEWFTENFPKSMRFRKILMRLAQQWSHIESKFYNNDFAVDQFFYFKLSMITINWTKWTKNEFCFKVLSRHLILFDFFFL